MLLSSSPCHIGRGCLKLNRTFKNCRLGGRAATCGDRFRRRRNFTDGDGGDETSARRFDATRGGVAKFSSPASTGRRFQGRQLGTKEPQQDDGVAELQVFIKKTCFTIFMFCCKS